jgi:allantoinase
VVVVRSTRIVLSNTVEPACIHIAGGTITRIADYADVANGELADFNDLVVSPGLVDTHVHVNEPGRTEWEGFDTATRAAAAGGVTTIVDMPLNSVPATTTMSALEAKRVAARGKCHVDVGFWGGVVPGNASELDALVDAGVRGFKCFLVPSGVDEFAAVGESDLRHAMPILARRGVPLLVHAELPAWIAGGHMGPPLREDLSSASYATYLATRPPQAEVEAVRMMVRLSQEFGCRAHIVHVACAQAAEAIARAKDNDVPITAETCPHYLTFAAEEIPDGATEFKCAPPIREAHHRAALWAALEGGVLDLVATDHSPAPPALKCPGDFLRAWGGIASLELSLSATWARLRVSEASAGQARGRVSDATARESAPAPSLCRLAGWMSAAPASLAQLDRKGRIEAGYDADLVIWDPDAEQRVDPLRLQQRHKLTPYAGRHLRGAVRTTFLRGERVWDETRLVCAGAGQLV